MPSRAFYVNLPVGALAYVWGRKVPGACACACAVF